MIFTAEDIQSRLRDRPFVPVRVVTSAGHGYDVHHPDLVFVGRSFLIVGTPDRANPTVADAVTRLALAHVTELRDLPVPVAPSLDTADA